MFITKETYSAYRSLTGKPKARGHKAGVYILTHIKSGDKYAGSSNNLSRRLEQYFIFNKEYGLLLPLIKKEGLANFRLYFL